MDRAGVCLTADLPLGLGIWSDEGTGQVAASGILLQAFRDAENGIPDETGHRFFEGRSGWELDRK